MKIKFSSDGDLLLKKLLKCRFMTIIISCLFSEDGKLYPQPFLDDTLYEYSMKKLMLQKELM